MRVVPIDARCAGRGWVRGVVPIDARYAGVVPGWCGRQMPLTTRSKATGAPNTPMQLTPLRVREILAFLKVRIGSNVIPIYGWRRT